MQLIIVSQNNMKQKLAALREKISEIIVVNFDSPFSAIDTRTSPKRKKIMKE